MNETMTITKEQAVETASPAALLDADTFEEAEVVSTEIAPAEKKIVKRRPSNEERSDTDFQQQEMRSIAGILLLHFKQAVQKKELDFDQELKLFKEIGKYIGYAGDGNKIAQDVGMDSFAMKYLEINTRINKGGTPAPKG